MTQLIGISGKIGSGKDTVALIIQLLCEYPKLSNELIVELMRDTNPGSYTTFQVKKFAGKLKQVASLLTGIPAHKFEDQEFKKEFLPEEWSTWYPNSDRPEPMTVRELLQKLGTDAMRVGLHKNVWVNATFADFRLAKISEYNPSKWIITDVRFPNEAKAIIDRGGLLLRLERTQDTGDHPSETALDDFPFENVIYNTGTMVELVGKVRTFLTEHTDIFRKEKITDES